MLRCLTVACVLGAPLCRSLGRESQSSWSRLPWLCPLCQPRRAFKGTWYARNVGCWNTGERCFWGYMYFWWSLFHLSLNRAGRWGTTDDFTTSFLLFFSVLHWPLGLANSRPVLFLMLSSHLFFFFTKTSWQSERDANCSGMDMSPVHQVWLKRSCKAQWKGEEDKADRRRGVYLPFIYSYARWHSSRRLFGSLLLCPLLYMCRLVGAIESLALLIQEGPLMKIAVAVHCRRIAVQGSPA